MDGWMENWIEGWLGRRMDVKCNKQILSFPTLDFLLIFSSFFLLPSVSFLFFLSPRHSVSVFDRENLCDIKVTLCVLLHFVLLSFCFSVAFFSDFFLLLLAAC